MFNRSYQCWHQNKKWYKVQVVSLLAMYYIVYGFLYLLSLLPFWVLHGISSLVYFFLYRVFGYRKKVVMANLLLAFPEKTEAERDAISAKFYLHRVHMPEKLVTYSPRFNMEYFSRKGDRICWIDARVSN